MVPLVLLHPFASNCPPTGPLNRPTASWQFHHRKPTPLAVAQALVQPWVHTAPSSHMSHLHGLVTARQRPHWSGPEHSAKLRLQRYPSLNAPRSWLASLVFLSCMFFTDLLLTFEKFSKFRGRLDVDEDTCFQDVTAGNESVIPWAALRWDEVRWFTLVEVMVAWACLRSPS
ncbi:hypothetical protein F2Q69_00036388 [Brassica cretica]|uniref:Uncharacterized protein n=1 Tax=Brassica cretica TaxID=69181 RepID=A0A8S9SSA7_BRACR|nr:hypothetical protein F2Q69_00036388 [Brassica cretica]